MTTGTAHMTHQHLDDLITECNSLSLRLMAAQAELVRARRLITTLYDVTIELAAPATAPRRGDTFEKHIDHVIACAKPWIDPTARNIRVGNIPNFDGRQVLLEVLPNGEFHLASRDAEWNTWSAGVWGWLS